MWVIFLFMRRFLGIIDKLEVQKVPFFGNKDWWVSFSIEECELKLQVYART